MKRILFVILLCAASSAVAANGPNGTDLRDECGAALDKQSQSGARAGLCVGFVNGYRQLAAMRKSRLYGA
jgi:hypothetical protein